MKVDIWSDIACPFCYLGKVQFERALESFSHKDKVDVLYHSFELDPTAPREYDGDMYDMLEKKKGMPRAQVEQMVDSIAERAASEGLTYNMKAAVIANTHDAHRLTHFAAAQYKQAEMIDALYAAYFTDGKHVGNHETLGTLAERVGLDKHEVLAMLESDDFNDAVQRDVDQAAALGISGVPFFVIDQKYGVSGAQGKDVFMEVLQKAWHEAHPIQMVGGDEAAMCVDNSC